MTRNILRLATLALLTIPAAAYAGTDSDNLDVSATVSDSCSISAGDMSFGAYDTVGGAAVDGSAVLTVACTSGAAANITLDQGANPGGSSSDADPDRMMSDGGTNLLSYSLFQDSGHVTEWGNTSGTGVAYDATSSAPEAISVYGRIAASQDVPAGSYSDIVVATISF